eukprot:TRINITY_DN10513_c0_g1_i1.p1 TRINITY_DN10513_c0_g1~~TRINITY_DN10513_c0_g1_i1.p1  ORF type:complete len:703 (+),score=191.94 TRINITY_DN10513_c0_g1_i1:191-2299(+)
MDVETEHGWLAFDLCIVADHKEAEPSWEELAAYDLTDVKLLFDDGVRQAVKLRVMRYAIEAAQMVVREQLSVDENQIYFSIHLPEQTMKRFAEHNQVLMHTRESAGLGGGEEPYTRQHDEWFEFSPGLRQRLCIQILKTPQRFLGAGVEPNDLVKERVIKLFFPLHHQPTLNWLKDQWAGLNNTGFTQPVAELQRYFGDKLTMYFAWLAYYTLCLTVPSLLGVFIGCVVLATDKSYYPSAPEGQFLLLVFAFVVILWATAYQIVWERQQRLYAWRWGSELGEEQEVLRDEYEGTWRVVDLENSVFQYPLKVVMAEDGTYQEKYYPKKRRLLIMAFVSWPILLALMGVLVFVLWLLTKWRFNVPESDGLSTEAILASAATVGVMIAFNFLYDFVAMKLNGLENHRTDTEYEAALVRKSFVFQFVNNYSALVIIALWQKDGISYSYRYQQLSFQLLVSLAAKPLAQNLIELLIPVVKNRARNFLDTRHDRDTLKAKMTELDRQANLEPFINSIEEYLEVVIQFGYLVMFSSAFSWGAVLCLIYNLVEIRLDASKFVTYLQRPPCAAVSSVGVWQDILKLLTLCGIVTNAYVVSYLTDALKIVRRLDNVTRLGGFLVVQYVLLAAVIAPMVIPFVPASIRKAEARRSFLLQRAHALHSGEELTHHYDGAAGGGGGSGREGGLNRNRSGNLSTSGAVNSNEVYVEF